MAGKVLVVGSECGSHNQARQARPAPSGPGWTAYATLRLPLLAALHFRGSMKFTINLDKEDFRHFNKFAMARIHQAPGMKWKVTLFNVLYWFLLMFFALEMYSVYDKDCCNNYEHLNRALIAFGVWFILVNAWQQIYMRLYVSAATDENGSVLGKWEFEISNSGVTESNSLCSSSFTWQSIQSVEKDQYNLYLFTDRLKALILPLSQINEEIELAVNKNVTSQSTRTQ